jgi:YVTN family beta-propeller protein
MRHDMLRAVFALALAVCAACQSGGAPGAALTPAPEPPAAVASPGPGEPPAADVPSPAPRPARAAAAAVPSPSPVAGQSLGTPVTGEFAVTANLDDRSLSVVPIGLAQAMPPVRLDVAPRSVATWMNTSRAVAADGSPGADAVASVDLANPRSPTDTDVRGAVHVFSANAGGASALVLVSDSDNTLRTLDPSTGTLGPSLQVGQGPHAVTFAAATATSPPQIYVANAGDGSVSVLDGSATSVQHTITVGGSPIGVAVVPTNRLWIVDAGANDVYAFDPASGRSGSPIGVGPGLKAAAATSDGHYLVLASSDTLYRVDLFKLRIGQAAAEVASLPMPGGVLALATGAEITLAYATTADNHLVYWDLVDNAIAHSVAVGANPVGLALGLALPNNTLAPAAMVGGGTTGGPTGSGAAGGSGGPVGGAGGSGSAGSAGASNGSSASASSPSTSSTTASTGAPASSGGGSSSASGGTAPISIVSNASSASAGAGGSGSVGTSGSASTTGATGSGVPPSTGASSPAGGGASNPGISTIANLSNPSGGGGRAGSSPGSSSASSGVVSSAGATTSSGTSSGVVSGASAGSPGSTSGGSSTSGGTSSATAGGAANANPTANTAARAASPTPTPSRAAAATSVPSPAPNQQHP